MDCAAIKTAFSQLKACAIKNSRDPQEIVLMAASKTRPFAAIEQAAGCGIKIFGENYVQEAALKLQNPLWQELKQRCGLRLHLIGPLQSNKAKTAAALFDSVDTLTSCKTAAKLNSWRAEQENPLDILIQYNSAQEPQKAGLSSEQEVLELAKDIMELPHLRLRGLMCIAPLRGGLSAAEAAFSKAAALLNRMQKLLPGLDTLSMGMSADFMAAIAHGATMVRLGTALFGER